MSFWPIESRTASGMFIGPDGVFNVDKSVGRTTVTASATIHTKGAWTELIASTPHDGAALWLYFTDVYTSGVATDQLCDIGVGAAGAEIVVIPNILIGYAINIKYMFPLTLPAGTRLVARTQALISSDTMRVYPRIISVTSPWGGALPQIGSYTAYGADLSLSSGVSVPPGASADTWGAWTQITAATAAPHRLIVVGQTLPAGTTAALATADGVVQTGVGASGSEQSLSGTASRAYSYISTSERVTSTYSFWLNLFDIPEYRIPSGSRLSARNQSEKSPADNRAVILYGGN